MAIPPRQTHLPDGARSPQSPPSPSVEDASQPARFVHMPLNPVKLTLLAVLVILLEPLGMYGRWLKTRVFFSTFPMYKRATFRRQKTYMRSERLR